MKYITRKKKKKKKGFNLFASEIKSIQQPDIQEFMPINASVELHEVSYFW